MSQDSTTHPIKVSEATWRDLNALKQPGDSFDDVVVRLLESEGEADGSE
jgi:predicted CopG family antitoxin